MSALAWIFLLTALGVAGLLLVVSGAMQPAPTLDRVLAHLQRPGSVVTGDSPSAPSASPASRVVSPLVRALSTQPRLVPSAAELRLVGRTLDQHVLWLGVSAVVGLTAPPLIVSALQSADIIGLGWFAPVIAGLACAVIGPLVVHTTTVERANDVRADFRYQVSAYLDVVTMLLAGNTGYEGALEQAAHAGDGRLFAELRRRMRESGARGSSLTDALQRAGSELGLDELEQIAATAALSAAEGAPVARTLAAKCATLRAALSTEQESEARLRTSRLTTPIVGMALIFMSLVMYPALSFS